jgi:hypothetical protein
VRALYGEGEKPERDRAYATAMEAVHREYPNDLDAADFDSLALLGLAYGGASSDAGATENPAALRTRMRAAAVAQEVFRREPKQRSPGPGPGWDGRTGPEPMAAPSTPSGSARCGASI